MSQQLTKKTQVAIYSQPSSLAVNLLERLISNGCEVQVYADDISLWNELTARISLRNFTIQKTKTKSQFQPDYFFVVDMIAPFTESIERVERLLASGIPKGFLVTSIANYTKTNIDRIEEKNIAVVYVTDLVDPRVNLYDASPITEKLMELFKGKLLKVSKYEDMNLVGSSDVARTLAKWLFSFGPYGTETLVCGTTTNSWELYEQLKKTNSQTTFEYDEKLSRNIKFPKIPKHAVETNITKVLGASLTWIKKSDAKIQKVVIENTKKGKPARKKFILPVIVGLFTFLVVPLLLLLLSGASILVAKNLAVSRNYKIAEVALRSSGVFATGSRLFSIPASVIPPFSLIFKPVATGARVFESAVGAGLDGLNLARDLSEVATSVVSGAETDQLPNLDRAHLELEQIYNELSHIQGELEGNKILKFALGSTVTSETIEKVREILLGSSKLVRQLPLLLGHTSKKTYLILFQNNMELRPTGGFIGSFALSSFENGKMTEISVSDVYSADGQLKGHIEPPNAIKTHLGEANWYLRDSNWDPDFPTSAERAEWFLEKEIGQKVDGVIAIDLFTLKDMLKLIGPIQLTELSTEITHENVYEKIQSEVEGDFFPGSRKKANLLTALSKSLLQEITNMDKEGGLEFGRVLLSGLSGRHIQLFLHDSSSQEALTGLGWSGSVSLPDCSFCNPDLVSLIEANVGVNKSNYFITRKVELLVSKVGDKLRKEMKVSFENTANSAMGRSAVYKNYLRLLIPQESESVSMFLESGVTSNKLILDELNLRNLKEVGTLIEIPPSSTRALTVLWESPIKGNEYPYEILIRKQAGVEAYPIKITFLDFLTEDGVSEYNRILTQDLSLRFFNK